MLINVFGVVNANDLTLLYDVSLLYCLTWNVLVIRTLSQAISEPRLADTWVSVLVHG